MKKTLILIVLLLVCAIILFTSCSFLVNENTLADATFAKLVNAVEKKNHLDIVALFSKEIQADSNLSQDAFNLVDFIQGEIVSRSFAEDAGVGSYSKKNYGKIRKEIQASFCIVTTKNKYYVAIMECIRDDFNKDNEGVLSIYIIEAEDFTDQYVYRGDGEWREGINIQQDRGLQDGGTGDGTLS